MCVGASTLVLTENRNNFLCIKLLINSNCPNLYNTNKDIGHSDPYPKCLNQSNAVSFGKMTMRSFNRDKSGRFKRYVTFCM